MGCRTRVMGNVHDRTHETTCGRGNLSFTSINLPRIGIEAKGDIKRFYELLDKRIDLVIRQLLHRFQIQCGKKVYNYPFLMGQGVWLDSDKLGPEDNIAEVLKHGTLSIGFIGLQRRSRRSPESTTGRAKKARSSAWRSSAICASAWTTKARSAGSTLRFWRRQQRGCPAALSASTRRSTV